MLDPRPLDFEDALEVVENRLSRIASHKPLFEYHNMVSGDITTLEDHAFEWIERRVPVEYRRVDMDAVDEAGCCCVGPWVKFRPPVRHYHRNDVLAAERAMSDALADCGGIPF